MSKKVVLMEWKCLSLYIQVVDNQKDNCRFKIFLKKNRSILHNIKLQTIFNPMPTTVIPNIEHLNQNVWLALPFISNNGLFLCFYCQEIYFTVPFEVIHFADTLTPTLMLSPFNKNWCVITSWGHECRLMAHKENKSPIPFSSRTKSNVFIK